MMSIAQKDENGSQGGYSLIEALIAASMVAFIGCTLALGLFQYKKIMLRSQLTQVVERQIRDIVENIRPNIGQYQINFDGTSKAREDALSNDKLPMAWTVGLITQAEKCATCPGRFGYTVQPLSFKGLYRLSLRVTHKDWDRPRDYVFLVTSK